MPKKYASTIIENNLKKKDWNLDLSGLGLESVPAEIGKLTHLTRLQLGNNKLKTLPNEITELKRLEYLFLHANRFSQLPEEVLQLKNLIHLSLDGNSINSLPERLSGLTQIESLTISDNPMGDLSEVIFEWPRLRRLEISRTGIKDLPRRIEGLSAMQWLSIAWNPITHLPEELFQLKNLSHLNLSGLKIGTLPERLWTLQKLKFLFLEENQLEIIPPEIAGLQDLRSLKLDDNLLSSLPDEFALLSKLSSLSLCRNRFSTFPEIVLSLERLTQLDLSGNRLEALHPKIAKLKNIKNLQLAGNKLNDIPLIELKELEFLNLEETPLSKASLDFKLMDKYKGSLFGLAVSEALGNPLKGKEPGTFKSITEGVYRPEAKPAQWLDGLEMALCLSRSLVEEGFNPAGQMERYWKLYKKGYVACKETFNDWELYQKRHVPAKERKDWDGLLFDTITQKALDKYEKSRKPFCGSNALQYAGNGSLKRLAPIPLYYSRNPRDAIIKAGESSVTTHATTECIEACRYLSALIVGAVNGASKDDLLADHFEPIEGIWNDYLMTTEVNYIASGSFKHRRPPAIKGSANVVRSIEAALWAFFRSATFKEGALLAVNLGDDAP